MSKTVLMLLIISWQGSESATSPAALSTSWLDWGD